MSSSKPTTLPDGALEPAQEVELLVQGLRRDEPIGSFGEYVEAVLQQDGLQLDPKAVLRDSGTANLYRRYLDLRLPGPWLPAAPPLVVKIDRRR